MKLRGTALEKVRNLVNKVNCINILQYFHSKKVLLNSILASKKKHRSAFDELNFCSFQ